MIDRYPLRQFDSTEWVIVRKDEKETISVSDAEELQQLVEKAIDRLASSGLPEDLGHWLVTHYGKPKMKVVAKILDDEAPWIPNRVIIEPEDDSSFLLTPVMCIRDEEEDTESCYTITEWTDGGILPQWTIEHGTTLYYEAEKTDDAVILDMREMFGDVYEES